MTLSQRIAAAQGPDRALDAEIAKTLGLPHGPYDGVCIESRSTWHIDEQAAPFLASIDAAISTAQPAIPCPK